MNFLEEIQDIMNSAWLISWYFVHMPVISKNVVNKEFTITD